MSNAVKTISSQRYIDDDIVAAKSADGDYEVLVSPEFSAGGLTVRAVLDGHHSLEAAKVDEVEPEYREATMQDSDNLYYLESGDVEGFLQAVWIDSEWYDVATGELVF